MDMVKDEAGVLEAGVVSVDQELLYSNHALEHSLIKEYQM